MHLFFECARLSNKKENENIRLNGNKMAQVEMKREDPGKSGLYTIKKQTKEKPLRK